MSLATENPEWGAMGCYIEWSGWNDELTNYNLRSSSREKLPEVSARYRPRRPSMKS